MKKLIVCLLVLALAASLFVGCGGSETTPGEGGQQQQQVAAQTGIHSLISPWRHAEKGVQVLSCTRL